MKRIKNVRLGNVRSHTTTSFQFAGDMNAIVGPNGSGKTTLLEALYVLLRGSSFRGSLHELLQRGQSQYKIESTLQSDSTDHTRSLSLIQLEGSSQKKWALDDKKYARLPVGNRLPVVLFEPDLARLISGGPQRRREYLDTLTGQLDIEVAIAQNKFERTLRQRNQLLKVLAKNHRASRDDLFAWNTQLAHLSETIVTARHTVLERLQKEISTMYQQLGGEDTIALIYKSPVASEGAAYASRLLKYLEEHLERDIVLGHTTFGPHRDDIEVLLADQPAIERASRGEIRTIVIALKMLETTVLAQYYKPNGVTPTLLLDDVLSELDLSHQERVLAGLKGHQVFITTTDAHALTAGVHTIYLE